MSGPADRACAPMGCRWYPAFGRRGRCRAGVFIPFGGQPFAQRF